MEQNTADLAAGYIVKGLGPSTPAAHSQLLRINRCRNGFVNLLKGMQAIYYIFSLGVSKRGGRGEKGREIWNS